MQNTSNISCDGLIGEHFGRNRSDHRPYMRETVPTTGFLLSEAHISLRAQRPSLTAIQLVRNMNGVLLGFVGDDFALHDLPKTLDSTKNHATVARSKAPHPFAVFRLPQSQLGTNNNRSKCGMNG